MFYIGFVVIKKSCRPILMKFLNLKDMIKISIFAYLVAQIFKIERTGYATVIFLPYYLSSIEPQNFIKIIRYDFRLLQFQYGSRR